MFEVFEKEGLVENSKAVGGYMKEKLLTLAEKYSIIKEVRGEGLMLGVEFRDAIAGDIKHDLFDKKYLTGATATTLRILPPLIITKADADAFVDVLETVLKEKAI